MVAGTDCHAPGHPRPLLDRSEDETDEMIWTATGHARGIMARRQKAVRTNTPAWMPLHYDKRLIASLHKGVTGPVLLEARNEHLEGSAPLGLVRRTIMHPHRNAKNTLQHWISDAVTQSERGWVWGGPAGLPFGHHPHHSAHAMMASRQQAGQLLPAINTNLRLWVAVP